MARRSISVKFSSYDICDRRLSLADALLDCGIDASKIRFQTLTVTDVWHDSRLVIRDENDVHPWLPVSPVGGAIKEVTFDDLKKMYVNWLNPPGVC